MTLMGGLVVIYSNVICPRCTQAPLLRGLIPFTLKWTSDLKIHLGTAHIALFRQAPARKKPDTGPCAHVSTASSCLS